MLLDIKMIKLFVLIVVLTLSKAHQSHFYRRDYTYIEEFDAFYKIQWNKNGVSWNTAFTTCDDEGAKLFYPKEEGEWEAVRNLTSGLDEEITTADVIVGIHDEIGHGDFTTVDGTVTPKPIIQKHRVPVGQRCILIDMNDDTYKTDVCDTDPPSKRLFVCKRVDDRPCSTIDLSYTYIKETNKCYKVNSRSRSWHEAWHTCYMEGSMLVSIENDAEAKHIETIIATDTNYFSGYRKIFPGSDFYTVKGKKIQESGFQRWSDRQNENSHDSLAMCGTIFVQRSNGLYMTSEDCSAHLPFICEMSSRV